MAKLYALLLLLLITSPAFCQDADFFKPGKVRRELKAVKIIGSLKIDGDLNEPEWGLTMGASDFTQVEPMQGKPSEFVTIIKVLYNQKCLYVCVIYKNPNGKKAMMATDFVRVF